jgi:hypothetical protein
VQHLEARLLVVAHQGAQRLGILVGLGLDAADLAGGQAIVDQQQFHPVPRDRRRISGATYCSLTSTR